MIDVFTRDPFASDAAQSSGPKNCFATWGNDVTTREPA